MDYSVLLGWLPAPVVLYVAWRLLQSKAAEILTELRKIGQIEKTLLSHWQAIQERATLDQLAQLRERVAVLEATRRKR